MSTHTTQAQPITILIAGATGMMGMKIGHALVDKPGVTIRLLVRNTHKARQKLKDLIKAGAQLIQGDLNEPKSLDAACQGVDAIISTVQGDHDVIVTGQLDLLRAAEQAGVRRFIPSDYAFDSFRLDEGDNYNADLRRAFATMLQQSSVSHTFVFNGAFTEVELTPWGTLFDEQKTTFSYYGDGNTPFDITTTDDTALYVAEVVRDPAYQNKIFRIAGDILTAKQFLQTYRDVTGKPIKEQPLGSIDDLKTLIEHKKAAGAPLNDYLPLQYHYCMVSGKGKLSELQNNHYSHIHPQTLRAYLKAHPD